MKVIIKILTLLMVSLMVIPMSQATTITYQVANIAGNTWQYDYAVTNDTLGADIEEFTIFFELGLYENLIPVFAPIGWDPVAVDPDAGAPDDGFFDVCAAPPGDFCTTLSGLAPGDSLGVFSIQFSFLGAGTPGSQLFDIIDPSTINVLDSGTTQLAFGAGPVPVPAALWLFFSGIVLLLGKDKCHRR